jgi:hypothetical protein
MVPKQVGQSGHARDEPVAWTTLPSHRRKSVQTTVTAKT